MNSSRVPTRFAKPISCVTTIIVIPSVARSCITFSTSWRNSGSSADVGSSNSISRGRIANDNVGRHRNMRCVIRYRHNICCQWRYYDAKKVRNMHLHRDKPGRVRRGRRRRVPAQERTCAQPTRRSRRGRMMRGGERKRRRPSSARRVGIRARASATHASRGSGPAIVRASALAMRAAGRRSAMHRRHGPAKNSDTMQTMPANQTSERNDAQFSRYISA
ncbi:hypothetical protein BMULJ_04008 [Burkholderia multivorans ATCC 17616]|uniref:Uncharacterized protein n=1 Tax=Burkholderia multivorans (strain ATCC 17616 / 249) TaxID=395019 RepID=A0A0H3KLD3_BURM1|nr:hypothetical protein BMULJ_04008 [Burkholderia multivorans ATCC 17616]